MLIVIALIFIIGIIGAVFYKNKIYKGYHSDGALASIIVCSICLAIVIIVSLIFTAYVSASSAIEQKIQIISKENEKIEIHIAGVIENYQKFEKDIMLECSSDDSLTLIALYPELKSDKLVESQISSYVANQKEVIALKKSLIDLTTFKWWLYFGS